MFTQGDGSYYGDTMKTSKARIEPPHMRHVGVLLFVMLCALNAGPGTQLAARAGDAYVAPLLQAQLAALGPAGQAQADRKSTRLNSSHSSISYAVFCLKKNKDSEYSVIGFE